MNKIDYLKKLLETIKGIWSPAEGFLIVLNAGGFDESIVDTLIKILGIAIQTSKDKNTKKKLEGSLTVLEKLKNMEIESNKEEEKELDELLKEIDQLM